MRLNLPGVFGPDRFSTERLVEALQHQMIPVMDTREAVAEFHMRAPNGSVWRVTINDAGVLTSTLAQGTAGP